MKKQTISYRGSVHVKGSKDNDRGKGGNNTGPTVKLYLSAILDLFDGRIVSYGTSDHNDNPLVFKTFDEAVKAKPWHPSTAPQRQRVPVYQPNFPHQIGGGRYAPKYVQSCALYRQRSYGRRFTSKQELIQMIQRYIRYYNTRRVQRNLGILTPMEKHNLFFAT